MPEHFYLMILFLRESERQKNVSNVPGKTGKRRGRPPKRKKKNTGGDYIQVRNFIGPFS